MDKRAAKISTLAILALIIFGVLVYFALDGIVIAQVTLAVFFIGAAWYGLYFLLKEEE